MQVTTEMIYEDEFKELEGHLDVHNKSGWVVEFVGRTDVAMNEEIDPHVCSHCRNTVLDDETGYHRIVRELLNKQKYRKAKRREMEGNWPYWIETSKSNRKYLCHEVHMNTCNDCKLRKFGREYQDVVLSPDEITTVRNQIAEDQRSTAGNYEHSPEPQENWSNLQQLRFEQPRFTYTAPSDQWTMPFHSRGHMLDPEPRSYLQHLNFHWMS